MMRTFNVIVALRKRKSVDVDLVMGLSKWVSRCVEKYDANNVLVAVYLP